LRQKSIANRDEWYPKNIAIREGAQFVYLPVGKRLMLAGDILTRDSRVLVQS
jgi:hypothetical protein